MWLSGTRFGSHLLHQVKSLYIYTNRTQRSIKRKITANCKGAQNYRIYKLQAGKQPTFFGYFDKTPFNASNTKVLAMAMTTHIDWRYESIEHPLEIGYFSWHQVVAGDPVFHRVGSTESWCWQQGCMLQWSPTDAENHIVYNCLVEGQYGAVIQDVNSNQIVRSIRFPIYGISSDGKYGVSLNFSRLERLRPGYGYSNFPDPTVNSKSPDDDGIWLVDLAAGQATLVVSLRLLAQYLSTASMNKATHYVNHLVFSPDGQKLLFLHLWQANDIDRGTRQNRLMVYHLVEKTLSVVEDHGQVSHFSWISNMEIVGTRLLVDGSIQYCLYDVSNSKEYGKNQRRVFDAERLPKGDGHPSPSPDNLWLVTDTYPDRYGDQHLRLISLQDDHLFDLGDFYSPLRYRGVVRCDLHPRWDRDGQRICVDSARSGTRALYVIDLESTLGL